MHDNDMVKKYGVVGVFFILMVLFFLAKACEDDNPPTPPPGYEMVQAPVPADETAEPVASQPPPKDPRLNNSTRYPPSHPGDVASPPATGDAVDSGAAAQPSPKVGCGGAGAMAQQP